MIRRWAHATRRLIVVIATLLAMSSTTDSSGAPRSFVPEAVAWQRLEFAATKLFLNASTHVELDRRPSREAASDLIASPQGEALAARGTETWIVALESNALGRRSTSRVWFDPRDAAALQRHKRRHGKKGYEKVYRFTTDGKFYRRSSPADDSETRLEPACWSTVRESYLRPAQDRRQCGSAVSESEVLLYAISAAPLEVGESRQLCVFSDDTLQRVVLRAAAKERLAVDYLERTSNGENRRQGEIEVVKLSIEARPLDPAAQEEFELLGLEGDVEVYLDVESRVPVQVSGRLPIAGRVDVKLTAAELWR